MIEKEEGIWGWRGKIWGGKWGWLILKIAFPLRAGSSFSRNKGFQVGFGSKQPLDGIFYHLGSHFGSIFAPWGILGASLGHPWGCTQTQFSVSFSVLGPGRAQGCPKPSKMVFKGVPRPPKWRPRVPKVAPKGLKKTQKVPKGVTSDHQGFPIRFTVFSCFCCCSLLKLMTYS